MAIKKISFDLDNVIFNMHPLYVEAFRRANKPYKKSTSWNISEEYDADVCEYLYALWSDDMLYTMPVFDKQIPSMINDLIQSDDYKVIFVTQRMLKQPEKTFQQLVNAGIHCSFNQVYDKNGQKADILQELKPDIHFDDSPYVVQGCLEKHIPIAMISNNATLYNHHCRPYVKYYTSLRQALFKTGLCSKTK